MFKPIFILSALFVSFFFTANAQTDTTSYFGAQVKLNNVKYAEILANFHTILENNSADITDHRRFYGLGLKVGL